MARGVSSQFLRILDLEHRRALRALATGALLALLALFLAELADEPRCGDDCVTYAGTLGAGVLAGLGLGWWRSHRYGRSLRDGWAAWMRMSMGSTRVGEVYAKVRDRDPLHPAVVGTLSALLLTANVALFTALWIETPSAPLLSVAVLVTDGLVLGAALGTAAWNLGWLRRFHRALDELVHEGAVGVWGER